MESQQVARGGKITVEGHTIEFYQDGNNKWVVKHNGKEVGEATPVEIDLVVTLPNKTRVTPRFIASNGFLVYKYDPTCASYWNGAGWIQYCW